MCNVCSQDLKESYLNWLRHHEPKNGFTDSQEQILLSHSITILLTLRFKPVTVEEILKVVDVDAKEAKTLEMSVNKLVEDLEDCLIEAMHSK